MQHIIKKQVFSLAIDKQLDAFDAQHKAGSYYWREIVPSLQKAFDNVSLPDETIILDKLELNLGNIPIKELEKGNWQRQVYEKISEQLAKALTGNTPGIKKETKPSSIGIAAQWLFYMQHGYLHWSTLKIDNDWYQKVLEAFATDAGVIQQLHTLILTNAAAVKRIAAQHTDSFLQSLAETLTAQNQKNLPAIIEETVEIIDYVQKRKLSIASGPPVNKKMIWQQVLLFVSKEVHAPSVQVAAFLIACNIEADVIRKMPAKFVAVKRQTATVLNRLKKPANTEDEISSIKKDKTSTVETIFQQDSIEEEGIFIQHAGLVLLHPFLHTFFKHLELVADEKFTGEAAHEKALYLLHWMATGSIHAEEYELVMPKVLCGWHIEKPVSNSTALTEAELSTAATLLEEVIKRWDALKGTSPQGLREGFLQRTGKLYTKNSLLKIQVEKNTIDVLLDFLPWNTGMILLPWMKEVISVEWR